MQTLKEKTYTFHSDAGHAWLEVPRDDVIKAGVYKDITACSYKDNENFYLEEDLDAFTYLSKVYGKDNIAEMREHINEVYDGDSSWIRGLKHIK